MKIKVEKAALETVKALRARLAAVVIKATDANQKLTAAQSDESRLLEEIKELEKNDSLSEAAATKLAGKRIQLEQVQNKIETLSRFDGKADANEITANTALLREFAAAATAATGPSVEAYALEAAKALRPWCVSDKIALQQAYQLPACSFLLGSCRYRFGDFGASLAMVKAAIARADEILAGELNWNFDPKITG